MVQTPTSTVLSVSPSQPLRDSSLVAVPRSTWITGAVAYLARLRFPVLQTQGFGDRETHVVLDFVSRLEPPAAMQAPPGWKNPDFAD